MSRVTIRDMAKLLGVNISTVSRALKDHPDIGAETKKRVKELAEELGYIPNHQAVNFRAKKTKLIALILPELGRFFFPDMVKAIEEMTTKRGYNFITFQTNESVEREKECIGLCRSFGIDGLLAVLTKETKNLKHFKPLLKSKTPVVFVDKVLKATDSTVVTINDYQAAFTATEYLISQDYKKIAGIFDVEELLITREREKGFKSALAHYEIPYLPQFCRYCTFSEEGRETIMAVLAQKERPDAIFVISDELLVMVMQVIYALDLKVPNDIGIISISNGDLPYYLNPTITHIKHSGFDVGKEASNFLMDLIDYPDTSVVKKQLEIPTYLSIQGSC